MNESVVVGALVLSGAIFLLGHQWRSHSVALPEDAWLNTPARHVRRVCIAYVLGLLGALIVAVGVGALPIEPTPDGHPRVANLIIFVSGGLVLSMVLMILAFMDFRETTKAAARHALLDFGMEGEPTEAGPWPGPKSGEAKPEDVPIPTTKSSPRLQRAPDSLEEKVQKGHD